MKKLLCILFLLIFVTACSGNQVSEPSPTIEAIETTSTHPITAPSPTGTPAMTPTNLLSQNPGETVTFTTIDGINLAGTLIGEGDTAVIGGARHRVVRGRILE